NSLDCEIVSAK
nr:56 kda actin-sequestering protein, ASP-56=peptide T18 [swine, platelets, Peptide Partial, 11 aa] [Sus scrofa]